MCYKNNSQVETILKNNDSVALQGLLCYFISIICLHRKFPKNFLSILEFVWTLSIIFKYNDVLHKKNIYSYTFENKKTNEI